MSGGHAERAHALLSASKAEQWIHCPPSARLQEHVPDKRSEYADEGTFAHELAERYIRCILNGNDGADVADIEDFCRNNPHFNAETDRAVIKYVDLVIERYHAAEARSDDAKILLEERLDFSFLVPGGYGTGDAVIIADGVMEIIDLKFGKGVPVSAIGNPQLRLYALGALDGFGWLYDIREVHMTIVQPRLDSISTDVMTAEALREWGATVVRPAAELAWKGEGEFKPGDHCRWCKVKATCRARADENMKALAYEFQDPALLSLEEIGNILMIAERLKAWAKDVEEYAYEQALKGEKIPHHKLVEGRSNRTIIDKDAARSAFEAAGLDPDKYLKVDLLGISDLEKRIGKKQLQELIGDLIQKPPGKPVLVPETDKRPELNSIEQDFAEAFE
jgi:hypothetical protein